MTHQHNGKEVTFECYAKGSYAGTVVETDEILIKELVPSLNEICLHYIIKLVTRLDSDEINDYLDKWSTTYNEKRSVLETFKLKILWKHIKMVEEGNLTWWLVHPGGVKEMFWAARDDAYYFSD